MILFLSVELTGAPLRTACFDFVNVFRSESVRRNVTHRWQMLGKWGVNKKSPSGTLVWKCLFLIERSYAGCFSRLVISIREVVTPVS
jgi:hypothetical protein